METLEKCNCRVEFWLKTTASTSRHIKFFTQLKLRPRRWLVFKGYRWWNIEQIPSVLRQLSENCFHHISLLCMCPMKMDKMYCFVVELIWQILKNQLSMVNVLVTLLRVWVLLFNLTILWLFTSYLLLMLTY